MPRDGVFSCRLAQVVDLTDAEAIGLHGDARQDLGVIQQIAIRICPVQDHFDVSEVFDEM